MFGDVVGDDPWTSASWQIRTGVGAGSLGTLLYSGSGSVTRTATGNTVLGSPEYRSVLSGLSFFLPAGEYWMTLAPVNPLQNFLYVPGSRILGGPHHGWRSTSAVKTVEHDAREQLTKVRIRCMLPRHAARRERYAKQSDVCATWNHVRVPNETRISCSLWRPQTR